jgi:hypothetical protein
MSIHMNDSQCANLCMYYNLEYPRYSSIPN